MDSLKLFYSTASLAPSLQKGLSDTHPNIRAQLREWLFAFFSFRPDFFQLMSRNAEWYWCAEATMRATVFGSFFVAFSDPKQKPPFPIILSAQKWGQQNFSSRIGSGNKFPDTCSTKFGCDHPK